MQMAILSLMAVMVIYMAERLKRVNVTCKVDSTNILQKR
jgi:hypothetical protein